MAEKSKHINKKKYKQKKQVCQPTLKYKKYKKYKKYVVQKPSFLNEVLIKQ